MSDAPKLSPVYAACGNRAYVPRSKALETDRDPKLWVDRTAAERASSRARRHTEPRVEMFYLLPADDARRLVEAVRHWSGRPPETGALVRALEDVINRLGLERDK